MEIGLKIASNDDVGLVFRLMKDYYREVDSMAHPKKHRWELEKMIANPAVGRVWLVHTSTDVLGYLVLSLGFSLEILAGEAFLDDVYIIPGARRHGVARQAICLALAQAPSLGAHAVHVEVAVQNEKERAYFRLLGFQDRDRHSLMTYVMPQ